MADVLPDPGSSFGARVYRRLHEEQVVWLTTTGGDGTPQPNPVWFVWEDAGFLIYNRATARRLSHVRRRPRVSLHFNSATEGDDIVVFIGHAELVEDVPPADRHPLYQRKYRFGMTRVSGSPQAFARAYPVPVRVTPERVRGG